MWYFILLQLTERIIRFHQPYNSCGSSRLEFKFIVEFPISTELPHNIYFLLFYFSQTLFKKGKILQSERGVNSSLITILRFWPSSWKDRTLFIFGRRMVVCCFLCLIVLLQLYPILDYFKTKLKLSSRWERCF